MWCLREVVCGGLGRWGGEYIFGSLGRWGAERECGVREMRCVGYRGVVVVVR